MLELEGSLLERMRDQVRVTRRAIKKRSDQYDMDRATLLGDQWSDDPNASLDALQNLRRVTENDLATSIEIKHAAQNTAEPHFAAHLEDEQGDIEGLVPRFPYEVPANSSPPMGTPTGGSSSVPGLLPSVNPQPGGMTQVGAPAGVNQPNPMVPGAMAPPVMPAPKPPFDPLRTEVKEAVISAHLGRIWRWSGAATNSEAAKFDCRVFGNGVVMTVWDEGYEDPTLVSPDEHERLAAMAAQPGVDVRRLRPEPQIVGRGSKAIHIQPYDFFIDPMINSFNLDDAAYMGRTYAVYTDDLKREAKDANPESGINKELAAKLEGTSDLRANEWINNPAKKYWEPVEDTPMNVLVEFWHRSVYVPKKFVYAHSVPNDGTPEKVRQYGPGYYPLVITWATENLDEPLKVEIWPYEIRDDDQRRLYPFAVVTNRTTPGEWTGQSDPRIALEQQRALNRLRSLEMTCADIKSRIKILANNTAFTDEGSMDSLRSTKVVEVVTVSDGIPLAEAARVLDMPNIKPEVESAALHAQAALRTNLGVDEGAMGSTPEAPTTATAEKLEASRSGARAAYDAKKFAKFDTRIIQMLWQIECQYDNRDMIVPTVIDRELGGNGKAISLPLTKDHMKPARIVVTSGQTLLEDNQAEIAGIEQFITVAQTAMMFGSVINPKPLFAKLLKLVAPDLNPEEVFDVSGSGSQTSMPVPGLPGAPGGPAPMVQNGPGPAPGAPGLSGAPGPTAPFGPSPPGGAGGGPGGGGFRPPAAPVPPPPGPAAQGPSGLGQMLAHMLQRGRQ